MLGQEPTMSVWNVEGTPIPHPVVGNRSRMNVVMTKTASKNIPCVTDNKGVSCVLKLTFP